jgi:hypothetical protein
MPLTQTDRENIFLWTEEWFANSAVCLNEYLCAGKNSGSLCKKIAQVYLLKKNIMSADGILANEQLNNLYTRLQCLINLSVSP